MPWSGIAGSYGSHGLMEQIQPWDELQSFLAVSSVINDSAAGGQKGAERRQGF